MSALAALFARSLPVGLIVTGGAALGVVSAIASLLARRNTAAFRVLALSSIVSLAAAVAVAVALWIAAGRELAHGSPPWELSLYGALERATVAEELSFAAAALATPLLTLTFALRASPSARLLWIGGGALAALVFGYGVVDARAVLEHSTGECFDVHCRYAPLVEEGARSAAFATALVVAVGVAFVAIGAARAWRSEPARREWVGFALFALGAVAWLASRPLAKDAEAVVPLWDDTLPLDPSVTLPPAPAQCQAPSAGPEVEFTERGIELDGATGVDLALALDAKQTLEKRLGRGGVPLAIAAPPGTPARDVAKVIAIAHAAGYLHVVAVASLTRPPIVSASLGSLPRPHRVCVVPIDGTLNGESWGEAVARRSGQSPLRANE